MIDKKLRVHELQLVAEKRGEERVKDVVFCGNFVIHLDFLYNFRFQIGGKL